MPGPADDGCAEWVRGALERHERPLTLYAARLLGDAHRARDVVQETFLRLCRERPEELNGRLRPWLYTVCRRLAVDHLRREGRVTTTAERTLDARAGRETDPAERAADRDEARHVLGLVEALPPRQREMIELRFRHGLRYREIAEVTGTTLGNVSHEIHVAVRALRARLEGALPRAEGGVR